MVTEIEKQEQILRDIQIMNVNAELFAIEAVENLEFQDEII